MKLLNKARRYGAIALLGYRCILYWLSFVCSMLFGCLSYGQEPLSYNHHHIVFYDEFDYTDKFSPVDSGTRGTMAGQRFYQHWQDSDRVWGGKNYFNGASVSFPGNGAVRLAETWITPGCDSIMVHGRYADHWSGKMRSRRSFGYGILEMRARFPSNRNADGVLMPTDAASMPAFWTCCGKNEIDIFDVALFSSWLPHRVIDWSYHNAGMYSAPYGVTKNTHGPLFDGTDSVTDLSLAYHVYSCRWTPAGAAFYMDGQQLAYIPYSEVRLYPEVYVLELALLTNSVTASGQFMDVDWIKAWEPDKDDSVADVAAWSDVSGTVPPGLYRQKKITAGAAYADSETVQHTTSGNATIWEAEAIEINGNFIADESVTRFGPVTAPADPNFGIDSNYSGHYVYSNGFFEAKAVMVPGKVMEGIRIMRDAGDKLIIRYPGSMGGVLSIRVKDGLGRVKFRKSIKCKAGDKGIFILDVGRYRSGIYVADVTINEWHLAMRFVSGL